MDIDGRGSFRLLLLIIFLAEFFLLPVQLQMSPKSLIESSTHNDTLAAIENATLTPLLTLKQFDPIEEKVDLTTKRSQEARLFTLPSQLDEKTINIANTTEAQPNASLREESKIANPQTTQSPKQLEEPPPEGNFGPSEVVKHYVANVFTYISDDSLTLEEKIIVVEENVCHGICGSLRSSSQNRPNVPRLCNNCHCDPTCVTYHTCCPDLVLRKQITYTGLGSDCGELIATGFNASVITSLDRNSDALLSSMITKCHASTNGIPLANNIGAQDRSQQDILKSKCELPDISKSDELFPVTDTTTEVTYGNRYCAECNNIVEDTLSTWGSEVVCAGNLDLLLESDPNKTELYRILTTKEGVEKTGCYMALFSRQMEFHRACRYQQHPLIESCNETGLWPRLLYDPDIERACHMPSYSSIFMNKYKNMFCYLCNTDQGYTSDTLEAFARDATTANTARLSFSALIDFSDNGVEDDLQESETPTCQDTQFYDNLTCSCRNIECSEGKEFIRNENICQDIIESNMLGYRACAQVEIQTYGATTENDFVRLFRQFYIFQPSYRWKITTSQWCPGSRDFTIHLEIVELQPNFWAGPLESIERTLEETANGFCETLSHETILGQTEACSVKYVEKCPELEGYSFPCDIDENIRIRQGDIVGFFIVDEGDMLERTTFITYLQTNRCPFVEILVAEFNTSEAMLTHVASGQIISISKVDFIENNTKIRLCLDDYLQLTQGNDSWCGENSKDNDSFDTWTTAGLISIICSCISLLCLFLTFVTYVLFEQLRSGGGKNIMVLTVILFIAQALYEFAIEQYENEQLCSVLGISIHFFWLAAVFSMNACTWERFYKLCFPLKSRSVFMSGKAFLIATAYTFLCPVFIVACNISVNMSIKRHVGYGNSRLCYINERYSRIFSFVVPMCAVVVVNTILLVCTICKLRRKALPGNGQISQSRIGLVACARLSVVTGFTWLVSLLYEAVPVDAMGYIFTALLGLQGVVFFFSLVVNKKILEMYRKRFSRGSSPPSTSGSGSKTTAISKKSHKMKPITFHNIVVQAKKSSTLSAGHTDLSRLSSGDSGFAGYEAEAKEE